MKKISKSTLYNIFSVINFQLPNPKSSSKPSSTIINSAPNMNTNLQSKVSMSLTNLFFPTFTYLKETLSETQQHNPPYGECYSCEIDDSASNIVAGYSNGYINVFNITDRNKRSTTFQASEYPITCVRWNNKLKTTFISTSTNGEISHWHSTSGKILHKIEENGNNINSVDYSSDYKKFVTGGSDVMVRLYDEGMKAKILEMKAGKFEEPGHTSRIFALKFNPDNSNMIISGGWDKTIQIYDVREGQIVNSIYGPKICGDALDIDGYYFLSGAWAQENQICIYDYRMLKCVYSVKWENGTDYYPTYLYTAKYDKLQGEKLFAVGGVNENLYRLFNLNGFSSSIIRRRDDNDLDSAQDLKDNSLETKEDEGFQNNGDNINIDNRRNLPYLLFGNKKLDSAVYSIDFAKINNKKEYMACGCGDGGIRLFTIDINH